MEHTIQYAVDIDGISILYQFIVYVYMADYTHSLLLLGGLGKGKEKKSTIRNDGAVSFELGWGNSQLWLGRTTINKDIRMGGRKREKKRNLSVLYQWQDDIARGDRESSRGHISRLTISPFQGTQTRPSRNWVRFRNVDQWILNI